MTREQAISIKSWRQVGSWRYVHQEYQRQYVPKEKWNRSEAMDTFYDRIRAEPLPCGNQLKGRELCNEAMKLLNETWE